MGDFEQLGDVGRRVDEAGAHALIASNPNPNPILFTNRLCPFAHRAWWAALETGYGFEYIHVDLGDGIKPQWYSKINPLGTVPCLYVNKQPVFESLIISEYMENVTKKGLLPQDPYDRATVMFIISQFGDKVLSKFYTVLSNQAAEKQAELAQDLQTRLQAFDALFTKHKLAQGPYFNGNELSMVEIAIMPFLDRFSTVLKHYRQVDILSFDIPALKAAFEACKTRPAFKKTSQEPSFYISAYKKYATGEKQVGAAAASKPAASGSPLSNNTALAIGGAFAAGALVTYAVLKNKL